MSAQSGNEKSTIVRPIGGGRALRSGTSRFARDSAGGSRRKQALLRGTFGMLEISSPAMAGRLAMRLWTSVPVPAAAAAASGLPSGGTPLRVEVGKHAVLGWSWGSGPAVYLVHGWRGWGGQLGSFVSPLVEAGLRVVAYDAMSHGRSPAGPSGREHATAVEFSDALSAVVESEGPAHAVIAHSLGATATAVALLRGLRVRSLVFAAPVASVMPVVDGFAAHLGIGPRGLADFMSRVERRLGLSFADFDLTALVPEVCVPTLIVADTDDHEAPLTGAKQVAAAWPGTRLIATEGLGHRRLLRDQAVIAEVVRFVVDAAPASW